MNKNIITKLDNKDLQLRYFLGGLQVMNNNARCNYWLCYVDCSCGMVPEDNRLEMVRSFIKNHNITNESFMILAYNYLVGTIMKYKDEYTPLFIELDEILKPYKFDKLPKQEIIDNDYMVNELEKIVDDSIVKKCIEKFNITKEDFISIAQTILNYYISALQLSNVDDKLINEIRNIIIFNGLYVTKEFIEEYRNEYKKQMEISKLVSKIGSSKKIYLEAIKELLIMDEKLATEIIEADSKELKKIKKI